MQNRLRYKDDLRVMDKLIGNSKAFWIYAFHKSDPKWYWNKAWPEVQRDYMKMIHTLRRLKVKLEVYRFYIPKRDSTKIRPIGSPRLWSKAMLRAIELVCRELLEKHIGEYQDGFVRNKGCATTSMEVIKNLKDGNRVYQFDLDGFFNNVKPRGLTIFLRKRLKEMADYILSITDLTIPKMKTELQPEKELIQTSEGILKKGFTQGSPLSPLLSMYALEMSGFNKIKGLVMFADDGLVFRKKETDKIRQELFNINATTLGIKEAEDKINGWVKDKFKFLGLTYDLIEKTVSFDGYSVSWYDDEGVKKIVKYARYNAKFSGKPTKCSNKGKAELHHPMGIRR